MHSALKWWEVPLMLYVICSQEYFLPPHGVCSVRCTVTPGALRRPHDSRAASGPPAPPAGAPPPGYITCCATVHV